ncbi:MAG: P-loop NTPase [Paracoccaceae bacterium]|nr:MAG: P-loop NTPase [Paracoccaceae bacterium]
MHKISGLEGQPIDDPGAPAMDDDSFRKLAEEARRPLGAAAPLFRAPPDVQRAAPRGPVMNLPVPVPRIEPPNPVRVWQSLAPVTLDPLRVERNGLFAKPSSHPAAAAFDILRTRTIIACQENGWRRIAVTAPRHGCGTSLVAANLGLSMARRPDARIVLLDFDLRHPALATRFGLRETNRMRDMLTGLEPVESHLLRAGNALALGLNGRAEEGAAELLQSPDTADAVTQMIDLLDPEAVIFDLPPALDSDDVMAGLALFDAVILVADGTRTTAADITACERLFSGHLPLIGVVLNRSQELSLSRPWRRRGRR